MSFRMGHRPARPDPLWPIVSSISVPSAFVKPLWDGSSRGINRESLVTDIESFSDRIEVVISQYRQPALIEPFLDRGYVEGMIPNQPFPHEGMESFLPGFLEDFATAPLPISPTDAPNGD